MFNIALKGMRLFEAQVINSRLAMLGFVAAVGAEIGTGRDVIGQISTAPVAIAATFLVFIVASLIPILKVNHATLQTCK